MADERGISESELIVEISEAYKDVRMYWDKLQSYDGGNRDIGVKDTPRAHILYAQHIASLDNVRTLVNLGRKHFPERKTIWDEYDPNVQFAGVPSWGYPKKIIEEVLCEDWKADYIGANVNEEIVRF